MSASLVGSEMCIRDSECTGGRVHRRIFCGDSRRLRDCPSAPRNALFELCLLYTSDAADDM
eukprot:9196545-Alexandrium_andersonii.AAC.1